MKMTERDVLRLFLSRRENYAVSSVAHLQGRLYRVEMDGAAYQAVLLLHSFQFYEYRYHLATQVPTLVVCYEHSSVLPIPVLSLRAGNFAQPYELPELITDVARQRVSQIGSQVLLGQYLCGVRSAQVLINSHVPTTTRKRYLVRAKELSQRKRGKPVARDVVQPSAS